MDRYVLTLLMAFFCNFCCAQSVIRRNISKDISISKRVDNVTKATSNKKNRTFRKSSSKKGDDLMQGYSVVSTPDGGTYEGYFVNGQFSGKGKLTLENGIVVEGTFADGDANGDCTITLADGTVYYQGKMKDGEIFGHGLMLRGDSIVAEADWTDNGNTGTNVNVTDFDGNMLFQGNIKNGKYADGFMYYGYDIYSGYFDTYDNWIQEGVVRSVEEKNENLIFTIFNIKFTMVKVEGGTFTMGATPEMRKTLDKYGKEMLLPRETPTHQVSLNDYYIGQTEVTQALWNVLMNSCPAKSKGDNLPIENISWDDCTTFIQKINSFLDFNFRLPMEAEWEFAARGGNKSQKYTYSGSNKIDDVAWYDRNSGNRYLSSSDAKWNNYSPIENNNRTHPVGQKRPNELGLFDMSGNVQEFCYYDEDYRSITQGAQKVSNTEKICTKRGGDFSHGAVCCRASFWTSTTSSSKWEDTGLRLVLPANSQ